MRLTRKPYRRFWVIGLLRSQKAATRGRILGFYLPGCILWFRRSNGPEMKNQEHGS